MRSPRPPSSTPARHRWRATPQALLALSVACWGVPASAQQGETAYRCLVGPRTLYQSTPCAGGQRVEAADPRSDEQRTQADAQTQRLSRVADHLAAGNAQWERRIAAEAALQRPTVIVSKASVPKSPSSRRATTRHRAVTIRSASRGTGPAQAAR